MILFLDFDGVLHPEPCYEVSNFFIFLPRLEAVLRDFPSVKIVISSTWRLNHDLQSIREIFSIDISPRVIDVTPHWTSVPELMDVIGYQRHAEIEAWLRKSNAPWLQWVALDDKPYLYRPFLKNLVRTNSTTGFDEIAESYLRQKFTDLSNL